MSRRESAGFTLLEVLVAMVILSVAVVTLIQLASQGLRLLKLSSDHQEAALLADRLVRASDASVEGVENGHEGQFTWERTLKWLGQSLPHWPPNGRCRSQAGSAVARRAHPLCEEVLPGPVTHGSFGRQIRACLQRAQHVDLIAIHREHDDLRLRTTLTDETRGFYAIQHRHRIVHDDGGLGIAFSLQRDELQWNLRWKTLALYI